MDAGIAPARCNGCQGIFQSKSQAEEHARRVGHFTPKCTTRICTQCHKTFAKNEDQLQHVKATGHMQGGCPGSQTGNPAPATTVPAPMVQTFVCEQCSAQFANPGVLASVRADLDCLCWSIHDIRFAASQTRARRILERTKCRGGQQPDMSYLLHSVLYQQRTGRSESSQELHGSPGATSSGIADSHRSMSRARCPAARAKYACSPARHWKATTGTQSDTGNAGRA